MPALQRGVCPVCAKDVPTIDPFPGSTRRIVRTHRGPRASCLGSKMNVAEMRFAAHAKYPKAVLAALKENKRVER